MPTIHDPNNATRAKWAKDSLAFYASAHSVAGDGDQETLTDLLADILHLAAINKDIDFAAALTLAEMHFREEYLEEFPERTVDAS
jgi:hypothetical protein